MKKSTDVIQDVIVAAILFVSSCYILLLNPIILGKAGFPAGHVFMATALAAGLGSILVGWRSNAPSVVAPGMGLNMFIAGYVTDKIIPAPIVSYVLLFEGAVFLFIVSHLRLRQTILENLPPRIKAIVALSVGGTILMDAFTIGNLSSSSGPITFTTSLSTVLGNPTQPQNAVFLTATAVTLVVFYSLHQRAFRAEKAAHIEQADLWEMAAAASLLASIPFTLFLVRNFLPSGTISDLGFFNEVGLGTVFSGSVSLPAGYQLVTVWFGIVVLCLTVLFVQIMDISGTPYYLLDDLKDVPESGYEQRSERGFFWEAVGSLTSVFFQGSPAVCYAESNIAKDLRALRGRPAIFCGSLFLLVGLAGYFWGGSLRTAISDLPTLSLSPLIACLGVVISTKGLKSPSDQKPDGPIGLFRDKASSILAFGGAAFNGLTIGLACGLILEFILTLVCRDEHRSSPTFALVTFLAFVYLITVVVVYASAMPSVGL